MRKILCVFMALFILLCMGCAKNIDGKPTDGATPVDKNIAEEKEETVEVTLYFPDKQAISLVEETREVAKNGKMLAEIVVEELIKGTENEELTSLIPKGTALNLLTVENAICTVDLSSEFKDGASSGSAASTMCVYSIVNSLTLLDDVEKVQFLIDGETVEVFGNFIFSEPFEADESLNK